MKHIVALVSLSLFASASFASGDESMSETHPNVVQLKATLSATSISTSKTLRRWYVSHLSQTGRHPTVSDITRLTSASDVLYPEHGFPVPSSVQWTIMTTPDPRTYKVCYTVKASNMLEFKGALKAIDLSSLKRASGTSCADDPLNEVPSKFPVTVNSYQLIDLRDTIFPTILPKYPVFDGLAPKNATEGMSMEALPEEWGPPQSITVVMPSSEGLLLTGTSPNGSYLQFGTTIPNLSPSITITSATTLSPERFKVQHTCEGIPPGSVCTLSVSYKGAQLGSLPHFDVLRVVMSNGATAVIGVKGVTVAQVAESPEPKPPTTEEPSQPTPPGSETIPDVEPNPPAQPVPPGNLPVKGTTPDWPTHTFDAPPGGDAKNTLVFRNNTGKIIRLNHYPTELSWPFKVVPQADCPAKGTWMQPNETCTLVVTFNPPPHAIPGEYFLDPQNLAIHWQYRDCVINACSEPSPGGSWAGAVLLKGLVLNPPPGAAARVVIQEGNVMALGPLKQGKTYKYSLTLKNLGGSPAQLYGFDGKGAGGSWVASQGSISTINLGSCFKIAPGATCTVSYSVTPGSWMLVGQARGITYQLNGQDAASYQPLPPTLLQIHYVVAAP